MKKFQRFCTLFLLMIGLCSFALHAQSYAGLWRQVEQAQKKSLPQTVVKLTEKIYRKAELEKNAPQMLKAYICREAYQERLTPDSLYTNLKKLERWVESEKNLVNKAILHSLLALPASIRTICGITGDSYQTVRRWMWTKLLPISGNGVLTFLLLR